MIHPTRARLVMLCFGLWPLLGAQAQDSKPRIMLGPTPKICDTNGACASKVFVTRGEPSDSNGCTASWEFNGYVVLNGKKPKLRWEIKKDAGDTDVYKFHPNDGVKLNPADMNDPNMDLYDQGRDSADGGTFRWRDKNLRKREMPPTHSVPEERGIRFDLIVLRADGHQCAAGDPVIINRGP